MNIKLYKHDIVFINLEVAPCSLERFSLSCRPSIPKKGSIAFVIPRFTSHMTVSVLIHTSPCPS